MAKNGFKAMDSDMHVMEPCDLWQRYIDPKFADRAPVGLSRHKRDLGSQGDGKIMPHIHEVFRLAETADALRLIEGRKVTGKVIVNPQL